ncbi:MAG: alpha/beta hydrolase, partial [Sphingobacteriales bacterium]
MNNKYFISLFLLFVSFSLIAQEKKELIMADVVSINSKILKEERTVWVYNPGNKKERKTYPVIYVLDGEIHFKSVVAMVEYLSGANVLPPMIVVGILHPNRMRDLTTTSGDAVAGIHDKNAGGGGKFISFIKNELFTTIESTYPTAPYR